jgi:hypothetical protein
MPNNVENLVIFKTALQIESLLFCLSAGTIGYLKFSMRNTVLLWTLICLGYLASQRSISHPKGHQGCFPQQPYARPWRL